MDLSFGARLRQQRERQEVTLADISAATKIKVSLLEGLESGDVSHWPGGLFRRAYVRDYARAIGLDPEPIVREFLELYPDPTMTPDPAPDGESDGAGLPAPPETRFRRLFASVLPRGAKTDRERTTERLVAARTFITAPGPVPQSLESAPAPPAPAPAEPAISEPAISEPEVTVVVRPERARSVSLAAIADLCGMLARAVDRGDVESALPGAASLLDAVGVIVWVWDSRQHLLTPALAYGYAESLLARMRGVARDAPNAIAAAFRCEDSCTVAGIGEETGALVVPMIGPAGCVGVVALELQNRAEQQESVAAAARILAAQLATLVGVAPMAEAVSA